MTSVCRLAFIVALCGLAGCLRPSVELVLTLPKTVWEEDEFLWYKLEVKNVGSKAVTIADPFWAFQHRILKNQDDGRGTYLLMTDASGKAVRYRPNPFYPHWVPWVWTNDCGDGVPCEKTGFVPVSLKPGQGLVTTPSIQIPNMPVPKEHPKGFRILDTHSFPGSGRYRIRAVLNLRSGFAPLTPQEEIGKLDWCESFGLEVCGFLAQSIRENRTRTAPREVEDGSGVPEEAGRETLGLTYAESRPIDIEVLPASRPSPVSRLGSASVKAPGLQALKAMVEMESVVGVAARR